MYRGVNPGQQDVKITGEDGSSGISLIVYKKMLHSHFLTSAVVHLLKQHHAQFFIGRPVLEYKPVTELGAMP